MRGSAGEFERFGTVKVAKASVTGGGDLVFATNLFGATEVGESTLRSATAIRIRTGGGGSCKADKNTYQAPVQQICP